MLTKPHKLLPIGLGVRTSKVRGLDLDADGTENSAMRARLEAGIEQRRFSFKESDSGRG